MQKRENVYDEFMVDLQSKRQFKANTAKAYQSATNQIQKYMNEHEETIDTESIGRYYVALMGSNLKKSTVQQRIIVLRAFANYLYQHGKLNNQLTFKSEPTLYRPVDRLSYLTTLEFHHLKQKIYSSQHFVDQTVFRNTVMVAILVNTGVSSLEMSELVLGDVNMEQGTIRINGTNGKQRMLYIADRPARTLIQQYLNQRVQHTDETASLFLNRQGMGLSQWTVRNVVKQYLKHVGVKSNATVSTIQHSFIVDLVTKGATATQVQNITGVSSMVTSQVYAPFAKDQPDNVKVLKQLNRV